MAFWVHLPVDNERWLDATAFEPASPSPVPGKGYPVYFVEFGDFVFRFSSLDEIDGCIKVLSQKNLPDVKAELRGGRGPGSHWLNKLPGQVLQWSYRRRATEYLGECRDYFAAADAG